MTATSAKTDGKPKKKNFRPVTLLPGLTRKVVVARIAHECSECHEIIRPGTVHYEVLRIDGPKYRSIYRTFKFHANCYWHKFAQDLARKQAEVYGHG